MINRQTVKFLFKPAVEFIKFRILHVDDSPHRIALGVGLGFFVGFLPVIGFHMILALLMSFIVKANKAISVLATFICNPFSIVPMFVASYFLGRKLLFFYDQNQTATTEEIYAVLSSLSFGNVITHFGTSQFWTQIGPLFGRMGIELCIGCVVLGAVSGMSGYLVTYRFIVWYRKRHPDIKLH